MDEENLAADEDVVEVEEIKTAVRDGEMDPAAGPPSRTAIVAWPPPVIRAPRGTQPASDAEIRTMPAPTVQRRYAKGAMNEATARMSAHRRSRRLCLRWCLQILKTIRWRPPHSRPTPGQQWRGHATSRWKGGGDRDDLYHLDEPWDVGHRGDRGCRDPKPGKSMMRLSMIRLPLWPGQRGNVAPIDRIISDEIL